MAKNRDHHKPIRNEPVNLVAKNSALKSSEVSMGEKNALLQFTTKPMVTVEKSKGHALLTACMANNKLAAVRQYFKTAEKPTPNVRTEGDLKTALMRLAAAGEPHAINYLVQQGADATASDKNGDTADVYAHNAKHMVISHDLRSLRLQQEKAKAADASNGQTTDEKPQEKKKYPWQAIDWEAVAAAGNNDGGQNMQ
jgi:hypothetical protein